MLNKFIKLTILCVFAAVFAACASTQKPLKCNLHVIELAQQKNIYLPNTTANGLDRYLKNSKDWKQIPKENNGKPNHTAAYKAARSGKTVIAAYNGGKNNGHVVMVYGRRKMRYANNYGAKVPFVSGSVNGNKANITLLSQQFAPAKEKSINYFIYKP